MKKWLKRIAIALGVLVALGTTFSLWLQYTQSGARFALARVQGALDGKLAIADVSGTLSGPLFLSGVRYRDPKTGVDAQVAKVKVQFALSQLLGSVLHFENVDIDNVDIALTTIPPPAVSPPPTPLHQLLTPPLSITLDSLRLGRTQISLDKTPLFVLDSLELSANWTRAGIAVRQFALRTPDGRVDLNGALTSYTDYRGKAQADVDWNVAPYRVAGSLDFANDGRQSTFTLKLTQPFPATATGTLVPGAATLPWTLSLDVPMFDPAAVTQSQTLKSLALNLSGTGDNKGGTLTGSVDANAHRVLLDPLKFALAGQTLDVETLRLRSPEAAGTLSASGKVQLGAKPVGGEFKLDWDGVELPADLSAGLERGFDQCKRQRTSSRQGDMTIGPPHRPAHITRPCRHAGKDRSLAELKQPKGARAVGEIVLKPRSAGKLEAKASQFDPGRSPRNGPRAFLPCPPWKCKRRTARHRQARPAWRHAAPAHARWRGGITLHRR
jgi:translocation and assembly module TamB